MSEAVPPHPLPDAPARSAAQGVPCRPDPARRLRSIDLLQGADEVLIEHDGACYRLRRTALGRLILTK
jgi:hemin uptake protein HemP